MINRKKKRKTATRSRRRLVKTLRRIGVFATLLVLLGAGGWYLLRSGGTEDQGRVYLTEQAAPFSLPTIDGDRVSLADHLGEHNVLLYFNEGMG